LREYVSDEATKRWGRSPSNVVCAFCADFPVPVMSLLAYYLCNHMYTNWLMISLQHTVQHMIFAGKFSGMIFLMGETADC